MDRHPVALVRCEDYELARVEAAVRRSLDLLGGIESFVRPGQRVLLKPNIVRPAAPERAVSTHPAVVAAIAKLVIEARAKPVIAESPGGPYSPGILKIAYRKTGLEWAADISGAELNYDVESVQVSHPNGKMLRRLDLIKPALEADTIINLAKLKTHNLTTLTVAVKNLFGLVPGALKIGYHAKLRDGERLSEGLLDIMTFTKPTLNLVDAVVGMEGNGPSGGEPREIGALIAGADALAVDIVAAALVDLDPLQVQTTRLAAQRGLTSGRLEDVELRGDPLDTLRVADFKLGTAAVIDPGLLPSKRLLGLIKLSNGAYEGETPARRKSAFQMLAYGWFARQLVVLPHAGTKCTGCGYCARHCPVEAITVNGTARMDPAKCIRCYCCHELCPELAVELRRPWLGRVIIGR